MLCDDLDGWDGGGRRVEMPGKTHYHCTWLQIAEIDPRGTRDNSRSREKLKNSNKLQLEISDLRLFIPTKKYIYIYTHTHTHICNGH